MEFIQILTLAIVQGITEFLPISSSAHLILTPHLFGWADQGVVFDIAVHLGTLVAVLIYFHRDTYTLLRATSDIVTGGYDTEDAVVAWKLVIATVPLVILALFIADFMATGGRSLMVLASTSIIFGLLLGIADRLPEACAVKKELKDINLKDALTFGLFQALAIIPGTSRSGICMTGGRFIGCTRPLASRFATLMAIPTIMIAFLYSLTGIEMSAFNWAEDWRLLGVAVILAAAAAFGAIHLLMTLINKIGYWPFVIYRVVLGLVLIAFAL